MRLTATALRVGFDGLTRLRAGRPIHAAGSVHRATLTRFGMARPWGVAWLDQQEEQTAVVRLSRGAGLPKALPDLLGLAMRVDSRQGPIDLVLGATGIGPLGRHVLVPRRDPATAYSSLATYGSAAGRVRIAAVPERPGVDLPTFTLAAAVGSDIWDPFARLTLGPVIGPDGDAPIPFDAVLNAPPGLLADGVMSRARTPSYVVVRRRRSAAVSWEAAGLAAAADLPRDAIRGDA